MVLWASFPNKMWFLPKDKQQNGGCYDHAIPEIM